MVPAVAHLNRAAGTTRGDQEETRDPNDVLRDRLESLLRSGLRTQWLDRAYTSESVNAVVAELQAIPPSAHVERMRVAGFTLHPYAADDIAQSCATCMYYEMHRRFCVLPELMLPVQPEWSCRLWRI